MAVPKRKTSKSKLRMRKHSHRTKMPALVPCNNCNEMKEPHRACPACGFYRGRQVASVVAE